MKKTLVAAAFVLTVIGGGIAIQSPASAHPAPPNPALAGAGSAGLITTAASHASDAARNKMMPQPQQEPQPYPKYHDQQTDAYYSPGVKANPCRFTQAKVDGVMKQVEVCD